MSMALQGNGHQVTMWSPELLLIMDWRRFQELVRSIMYYNGFSVLDYRIEKNAGATILVDSGNHTEAEGGGAIAIAPWEHSFVESDEIMRFTHEEVQGNGRKIYVTPGSFSVDARECARMNGIELVDGAHLLSMLQSATPEQDDYLFRLATVGQFDIPSCPICAKKLDLRAPQRRRGLSFGKGRPQLGRRTLRYSNTEVISDDIFCRKLIIKENAEIHFLGSVTTGHAEILGRATGTFHCLASMHIGPRAVVSGMVFAKRMHLEEGGVMDGTTDVCNTQLSAPMQSPGEATWLCQDPQSALCEEISLSPRLISLPAE